jgi:hypothetical protein
VPAVSEALPMASAPRAMMLILFIVLRLFWFFPDAPSGRRFSHPKPGSAHGKARPKASDV